METRPVANAAPYSSQGSEPGPVPPILSPAVQPTADVVAITLRDDFLIELGDALAGSSIRPADSVAAAVEQLASSRRAQVLIFDTRDLADIRGEVELALSEAPNAVALVFAEADAEQAVIAATKGLLGVQAVLPIPVDLHETAIAFDSALAEATARKPSRFRTAAAEILPTFDELPAEGGGVLGRWVAAVLGFAALTAGCIWWWHTRASAPPSIPPAPAPVASAQSSSAETVATPAPGLGETTVVQGKVDDLLEKARAALRDRHFTQPKGDNALVYYRSALVQDPKNGEAQDGLQRVAQVLFNRFDEAMDSGRLDEAAQALDNLRVAVPRNRRLAGLEVMVAHAQISKAVAAGNLERANELVREAQQTGLVSPDQVASWKADIAHREDEAHLTRLAALVEDSIRDDKLTDPPDDNARGYVEQLKAAAPTSGITLRAIHDLASAFLRKAREAGLGRSPADVDRWLAEARSTGANPSDIEDVRREIAAAQHQKASETARLLGLFHQRLGAGRLSDPGQDSAVYYLTQLQSADAGNPALPQADHDLAAKLLDRARSTISTGKGFKLAEADLTLARRYGADPQEVSSVRQLELTAAAAAAPRMAAAAAAGAGPGSATPKPATPIRIVPKLVHRVDPEFPARALEEDLGGDVTVRFIVDVNGNPRDVRVVEARPAGVFDHAVIQAVKHWHYEPTIVNGKPVEVPVQDTLHFNAPQ